jgi:hypothetical protein
MIPWRVFPVQALLPSVFSTADPSSPALLGMTIFETFHAALGLTGLGCLPIKSLVWRVGTVAVPAGG